MAPHLLIVWFGALMCVTLIWTGPWFDVLSSAEWFASLITACILWMATVCTVLD
jgi:hypothetical protein